MYLPKSATQTSTTEELNPKQVYLNSKEFKKLLYSMQIFFRDRESIGGPQLKSDLLKSFWETTYELYKITPFHDVLLNYYGSFFCIESQISNKIDLLSCINKKREENAEINLEWGIKNWVVMINNTSFVYTKDAIDKLLVKAKPILDYYFSHSYKEAFVK